MNPRTFSLLLFISFFLSRGALAGLNSNFLSAVSNGDLSEARRLVSQGASVNAANSSGDTALMEIASGGHTDMPQLWRNTNFIEPTFQFPKFRPMSVSVAPSQEGMLIAGFLIRHGADVNLQNKYGHTALMLAAKYGQADLVRILLKHGARVGMRDNNGHTALDYAYQMEHQQVAALIEDYRLHPPSFGARRDVERLSGRNLSKEEMTRIASRVAEEAQNSTQKNIAHRLDVLAKEIESLKESKKAKNPPEIKSDVDRPDYHSSVKPDDFAIVVGVQKYAGSVMPSEFSQRDAIAVQKHFFALGVPEEHLRLLLNERATKSDLAAYLEDWLPKNVKKDSRVYFYFSGHGAPNPDTGEAYLVPFDGNPEFLSKTAYPLKKLYHDLLKISAHREIVILDSCFSGSGARSIMRPGLRPLTTHVDQGFVPGKGQIVVLTAARDNQTASVISREGHGLLTYYFLRGLNGKALDKLKRVSLGSLYGYLAPEVQNQANLENHSQNPQLLPRAFQAKIFPIILR